MSTERPAHIDGPYAWHGSDLARSPEWTHSFTGNMQFLHSHHVLHVRTAYEVHRELAPLDHWGKR